MPTSIRSFSASSRSTSIPPLQYSYYPRLSSLARFAMADAAAAKNSTCCHNHLKHLQKLGTASSNASSAPSSFGFRINRAFRLGRKCAAASTPALRWTQNRPRILSNHGEHVLLKHHKQYRSMPHHHLYSSVSARKLAASLWEHDDKNLTLFARTATDGSGGAAQSSTRRSKCKSYEKDRTASSGIKGFLSNGQKKQQSCSWSTCGHGTTRGHDKGSKSMAAIHHGDIKLQLANALSRMRRLEEEHAQGITLIGRLRAEVDQARRELHELSQEDRSHRKEIENLTKLLLHETFDVCRDEKEAVVKAAIKSVTEDLEEERMAKKKLNAHHRRIRRDLHEVKKSLRRALEELDKESKARQAMETVCDELAKEIGKDKARVERVEEESMRVREEVEEERRMLQIGEIWREERVQMKLTEAKLQLEEKTCTLVKLQSELEALLRLNKKMKQDIDEVYIIDSIVKHEPFQRSSAFCTEDTVNLTEF